MFYDVLAVDSWETILQKQSLSQYETLCAIWCHLSNLKNVKNTHGGVLFSVKFQAEACDFTKSNTPPWVFSLF